MAKKSKVSKAFSKAWNGFSGIGTWSKASKKAGSRAHKANDFVTPRAKTTANIARNKFGISFPVLESVARQADPEKMKSILAMGETGQNQQIMAPLIAQSITDKIKGVAAIQKMNTDILKATADGAVTIKRSINQAERTDKKLRNQIMEENMNHDYLMNAEENRHEHQNQTIVMNAYVQEYLEKSGQRQKLQQTINNISLSAIDEQREFKKRQLDLLQRQGSHADFDLLARKELNPDSAEGKMNVLPQSSSPIVSRAVRGVMNFLRGSNI